MNSKKLSKFQSRTYNPTAKLGRAFQVSESGQLRSKGQSSQFDSMWNKTTGKETNATS